MKKLILSLMNATFICTAFAANCVSVKQIGTDYANHKITIALTRTGCTGDATNHRNTVWVFVDYRAVTGNTKGTWTRATVSATSSGTVVNSGSSKGAWINGANGTQTVTLTLSGMPAKYDWCAFATDYPPNVTLDKGVFTFAGSASFVTSTPQTIAGNTIARASVTANAATTFIDASGCPGIGSLYCPYTGSDLYMDLTHRCQQRSSGTKNWEAWIKDTRDNHLYRIVQFSDDSWWFADYLATSNNRVGICAGESYYATPNLPACPVGWRLPSFAEAQNRWPVNVGGVNWKVQDPYGASLSNGYFFHTVSGGCGGGYGCAGPDRYDMVVSDAIGAVGVHATNWEMNCEFVGTEPSAATIAGRARCKK